MTEEELEWLRERILRAPHVAGDKEHPLAEDLIVDNWGATDVNLPVLAKMSALFEALRLSGSYEDVRRI